MKKPELSPKLSLELAATIQAVKAELTAAREIEEQRLQALLKHAEETTVRLLREFQIELAASLRMFELFTASREPRLSAGEQSAENQGVSATTIK
jgi:hypothetical protein